MCVQEIERKRRDREREGGGREWDGDREREWFALTDNEITSDMVEAKSTSFCFKVSSWEKTFFFAWITKRHI